MKLEPLKWPADWPRTTTPKHADFDGDRTLHAAAKALVEELSKRSGPFNQPFAHSIEVTVADGSANPRRDVDQGAAVYFTRTITTRPGVHEHVRYCFPCDAWTKAAHNVWAIKLHVASIRGQERWSVGVAERTLAGYRALPPSPDGKPYEPPTPRRAKKADVPSWAVTLGIAYAFRDGDVNETLIEHAFKERAMQHHPDRGGTVEVMQVVNAARDAALAWLRGEEDAA